MQSGHSLGGEFRWHWSRHSAVAIVYLVHALADDGAVHNGDVAPPLMSLAEVDFQNLYVRVLLSSLDFNTAAIACSFLPFS